jgi:hypothetical protein
VWCSHLPRFNHFPSPRPVCACPLRPPRAVDAPRPLHLESCHPYHLLSLLEQRGKEDSKNVLLGENCRDLTRMVSSHFALKTDTGLQLVWSKEMVTFLLPSILAGPSTSDTEKRCTPAMKPSSAPKAISI